MALSTEQFASLGTRALELVLLASLPPLVAGMLAGFVSSLFQALTQVQESSLSTVPRICAALAALAVCGPWMGESLRSFLVELLNLLPEVGL
jgi:flagellar biosynthetic protein FliQ